MSVCRYVGMSICRYVRMSVYPCVWMSAKKVPKNHIDGWIGHNLNVHQSAFARTKIKHIFCNSQNQPVVGSKVWHVWHSKSVYTLQEEDNFHFWHLVYFILKDADQQKDTNTIYKYSAQITNSAQCALCTVIYPCSKKSHVATTGQYQIAL